MKNNRGNAPTWAGPNTVAARATIWAIVGYCLLQGVGIVIGGAGRWSGPAFTYLRTTAGAPESWGWAIIVLGIILGLASLFKNWWLKCVALTGIATWSLGFAVGAWWATANVDSAATTGGPVYLLVTILAAIVILPDEARPTE